MNSHAYRLTSFTLALISLLLLFRSALLAADTADPVFPGSASDTLSGESGGVRVPVLMYHQISTDPSRYSEWCTSPGILRADILYLKERGYTFLLPSELLAALDGERPMPEKPVLLTFDDGYETALVYVLPILEELDAKATVSVLGSYCELYSREEDHNLRYSCLSWEQVAELAASGRVEIGCHSYDLHYNTGRKGAKILPGEDAESYARMLRTDTLACIGGIERTTGKKPTVYAFPYGETCPEAEAVLTELGFSVLLGCQGKVNVLESPSERPVFLERFNRPNGIDSDRFLSEIIS